MSVRVSIPLSILCSAGLQACEVTGPTEMLCPTPDLRDVVPGADGSLPPGGQRPPPRPPRPAPGGPQACEYDMKYHHYTDSVQVSFRDWEQKIEIITKRAM